MKPYYSSGGITIYHGDSRELMRQLDPVDVIVADPPYQQTSLLWDRWQDGWASAATNITKSMWVFGTMRMFMLFGGAFDDWNLSQDLVWEKHNGSSFHADRFRRVHESICHFYQGPWEEIYKSPPTTPDAVKRTVRTKQRPPHMGKIGDLYT